MRKVLLCRPTYFRVDYEINPWMKTGSVNQILAMKQWENLVRQYIKLGLDVEIIEQNKKFPDMVFAADQGVLLEDKGILLSRFRYVERKGESNFYREWYKQHGYRVTLLPADMYFEGGGELQNWNGKLLVGSGFRTNHDSAVRVGKIFNKEVISLNLVNEHFYHLDTCLMVLDSKTIFFYPEAFSSESVRELKSLVPNLLEISKDEVLNFAANSIVIGHSVVMQEGNQKMADQISKLGFNIISLNVGEFAKAGGGIHCLTGDLS